MVTVASVAVTAWAIPLMWSSALRDVCIVHSCAGAWLHPVSDVHDLPSVAVAEAAGAVAVGVAVAVAVGVVAVVVVVVVAGVGGGGGVAFSSIEPGGRLASGAWPTFDASSRTCENPGP